MGTNQSTSEVSAFDFSVSRHTVTSGECVDIQYNTRKETDFLPNTTFLEVVTDSYAEEILYSEELISPKKTISFRLPHIQGQVIARIIDTTVLEDNGKPKILCIARITVTKPVIIPPIPVDMRGVKLSLRGIPFCDNPQIIDISREGGVRSHDYIEFHNSTGRVTWNWCEGKTHIDFGIRTSLQDEQVTIKFYEEGRTFSAGVMLAEMKYTLRNPVQEMRLSAQRLEIQDTLTVSYKMEHMPTNCMLIGRCHGVRIFIYSVSLMEGTCDIPMPRLPGIFEVACIATQQGENELAVHKMTVTDQYHRASVTLNVRGYAKDHRIITLRPGQRFDVQATGTLLNAADEVVIVEAKNLFQPPSHTSLAFALQQKEIGEYGMCSLQVAKEGMYHVCLALVHDRAMLLGDWCTVIVSDRVGVNSHPVPIEPIPSVPLLSMPVETERCDVPPSAGFICAICLDKTVCMKFDPCKHVCTCEGCCQLIASRGIHACPICKQEVKSWEKVFLA